MSLLKSKTFLTRQDAAVLLRDAGVPVRDTTLENCSTSGKGPPYRIIFGRVLYLREDLEAWLERGEAASRPSAAA